MSQAERPDPAEVFTPARPVHPEMFARRHYGHLQERFEERLSEGGRQVVLYGDTGVGKTSLVTHSCETTGVSCVRVECGPPFEHIVKEALARAGITEDSFEAIEERSAYAGVRGTLGFLFAGGRHDVRERETSRSYSVTIQTAVVEALSIAGVRILFLDNFENLSPREYRTETATEIVQLMKSCSDRDGGVKVVVAGIPTESEELLTLDAATGRRTSQIEVPRMPDEELDEILRKGEERLHIEFDADCRSNIIRYSDGFPYYTHLHALHAVRQALRDGKERVELGHFMGALDSILDDADLTLTRGYDDAVETTGSVKTRKSIMEAVARLEKQEVTFREIKASFHVTHGEYTSKQLDFINPRVSELVDKYGVLQSRGIKKSPDRTYRFANPLMRAYVKLRAEKERRAATT